MLIMALDSTHDNFEITSAFFFYFGNKNLEKIQFISFELKYQTYLSQQFKLQQIQS